MEGKWREEEEDEYEWRGAAPATARRGDLPALEVTSVQAKRLKDRAVISTRALAEPAIAEVSVRFEFPDGSVAEGRFMQGQTVEVLKAWLESEFGLPMREVDLELNNRTMADPVRGGKTPRLASPRLASPRLASPRLAPRVLFYRPAF
jgi:hypothetical protein